MNATSETIEKSLYRSANTAVLSSVIIYDLGRLLGIFEAKAWYILLCFCLSVSVCFFVEQLSKRRGLTILVTLVIVLVPAMIVGFKNLFRFLKTYVNWALSMPGWKAERVWIYQIIQVVWIVLFAYLVQSLFERYFKLRIGVTAAIIILMAYYMISGYEVKYIGVVMSICFIAITLIEWTENSWNKKKHRRTHVYMLWMMPFIAVYFCLMLRMTVPSEPYDWKFIKDAYNYIQEKATIWFNDVFGEVDEYDLALSGFSEDGTIGQGIVDNHTEIMTLDTNRVMQTNVYLTGKVFNTFDGLTWNAYQDEIAKDRYIDTLETLYAAMYYDPGYLYNYAIKSRITICYKDLNTDYLFAPLKFSSLESHLEEIDFKVSDGSTYFQENINYGSEYNVYFYQMNADAELFYDFLEADVGYDEALWNKVLSDFKTATGITLTYEEIDSNTEKYYQEYMDCPELSIQVREHLDYITKDAKTDIEVLRAIEKELASYTYTQTPGKLPETVVDGSSFLDYFMLESKQGYCTHYATAFTLLARAKGYPARYVQGYCVPMLGERKATVTASMAHAWPEVYIEDVGWIAFEPTPGYGEIRYTPWTTKRITNTDNYYDEEFYSEDDEALATPLDVENKDEEKGNGGSKRILDIIRKLIIIISIGLILVMIVVRFVAKIQYKKKTMSEKYHWMVKRNLNMVRKLGYKMSETETLDEFSHRIQKANIKLEFIRGYEAVVYGDKAIHHEMLISVDQEYKELLELLKEKSRVRYIWHILWRDVG